MYGTTSTDLMWTITNIKTKEHLVSKEIVTATSWSVHYNNKTPAAMRQGGL